jgi:hypothetical protein
MLIRDVATGPHLILAFESNLQASDWERRASRLMFRHRLALARAVSLFRIVEDDADGMTLT